MQRLLVWSILVFVLINVFAMLMSFLSLLVTAQQPAQQSAEISIAGLVDNPLSLNTSELLSLPTVSETARLECIFGIPNATFYWTGIPLFHLLTLARVRPEAREVVFTASDGFSESLLIEDALKPYFLLGLRANGTLLSDVDYIAENVQGGFRVVAPGKYGYKWVTYVQQIEVVDYDYNGTYEQLFGYTQADADIPGRVPPSIDSPLQVFNLTFGARTFQIKAFTNSFISNFSFTFLQIDLNVTTPAGTTGFLDLIVPNSLLVGPYVVFLDANQTSATQVNVTGFSFIYLSFSEGSHFVMLFGTEFFGSVPEIVVDYSRTVLVGETVVFNASRSASDVPLVSFAWNFGDGTEANGPVVSHSYSKEGTYQVFLNVTDSDGTSVAKTLTVDVGVPPQYISLAMRTFLIADLSLVVLLFIILVLRREPQPVRSVKMQSSGHAA